MLYILTQGTANNFMERDGLLTRRFGKLAQGKSFEPFPKWGARKPPAPNKYVIHFDEE